MGDVFKRSDVIVDGGTVRTLIHESNQATKGIGEKASDGGIRHDQHATDLDPLIGTAAHFRADTYDSNVDETCRVPRCGKPAVAGEWREPFGRYQWGVHLAITVEDIAFNWPLCTDHADALLVAALDAVGATLNEWNLDIDYRGLQER